MSKSADEPKKQRVKGNRTQSGATVEQREHIEALETVTRQLDSDIDFLVWELRPTAPAERCEFERA